MALDNIFLSRPLPLKKTKQGPIEALAPFESHKRHGNVSSGHTSNSIYSTVRRPFSKASKIRDLWGVTMQKGKAIWSQAIHFHGAKSIWANTQIIKEKHRQQCRTYGMSTLKSSYITKFKWNRGINKSSLNNPTHYFRYPRTKTWQHNHGSYCLGNDKRLGLKIAWLN